MDKSMFEACLESQMGSDDEAEKCTAWFVQSACDGAYIDNRGDVESFVARENFVTYLKRADERLRTQKKCDPMGVRRLVLSEIARDKDADQAVQMDRWRYILSGMKALLPEQQLHICSAAVEDPRFEALMADKASRSQLTKCLTSLDAGDGAESVRVAIVSKFESVAPELLTEDSRAFLILDDINAQRYETARARLETIDVSKLSSGAKKALVERVAPLGGVIFRESLLDSAIVWRPGFEAHVRPGDAQKLALWRSLMNETGSSAVWYAELEAGLLLPRGEVKAVASRAAGMFAISPQDDAVAQYISKLIKHACDSHQYLLLEALATSLGTLDGNARDKAVKRFGRSLTESLLAYGEAEIQHAASKTKIVMDDISEQSVSALEALLKIGDPALRSKVCIMLGRMMSHRGNDVQALKLWNEAMKDERDVQAAQEARFLTVILLQKQGKKAEAASQAAAFEEKFPASKWLLAL